MTMNLFRLTILCSAIAFASAAQAEIYKRVDKDGNVTYSSAPLKGAKKLELEPLPTMAAQPVPTQQRRYSESSSDLRVNSETQNRRDDTRRKILEDELATEERMLDEARAKLKEAEDNPEVYKTATGQTFRNVAKYEEKVNAAQDDVKSHENNIKALKTEISNLR
jgi:chromosome segregation ATPase